MANFTFTFSASTYRLCADTPKEAIEIALIWLRQELVSQLNAESKVCVWCGDDIGGHCQKCEDDDAPSA